MRIDQTLRLLMKAPVLTTAEFATALRSSGAARAGVATVSAWMRGEKLPGREQLNAYRVLNTRQQGALLEVARSMAGHKHISRK